MPPSGNSRSIATNDDEASDIEAFSGDIPEHWRTRTCDACDHVRVIVRPQEPRDYEAAKVVYAEAFKRQDHGDRVPPEVGIFAALWEAKEGVPVFARVVAGMPFH